VYWFIILCLCTTLLNCNTGKSLKGKTISQSEKYQESQMNNSNGLIDLNSASVSELEKLPGIGERLARRIVQHREKFGKFRRTEHVMIVKGISDKKYRKIRHLITVK
jgi:competence protein ComEA